MKVSIEIRIYDADWPTALSYLKNGAHVTRFCSTWKNCRGRLHEGRFQKHFLDEKTNCWSQWTDQPWNTYPANIEATDWIIHEVYPDGRMK